MATRERPLPPTYFTVALLAMIALHFVFPILPLIQSPWRYLGLAPLAAGVLLNLWADRLFKKHGTEVKPFRDSSVLVLEGPFRFSRNPMYLGGVLILMGAGLLLGSASPLPVIVILFWLATTHFIIPEERDMERQFGDRYREYRWQVRRWL